MDRHGKQIVKAVGGRVPVFLDGGVRRGTDVFKALALGASGVFVSFHTFELINAANNTSTERFPEMSLRSIHNLLKPACGSLLAQIGRPIPFALAVDGEAGATKVLQMLRDEFELTMALMGVRSVKEIRRQHVQTEQDAAKLLLSKL